MTEKAKVGTKVVTGKVRFSYANVFTPKAMEEGGEAKYSISVLIDKKDTATIARINAAIDAAIEVGKNKLADKNGRVNKAALKLPLRDGDIDRADDPAYAGKLFINASSNRKPGIIDADKLEITTPDEFYSGCYGRASINFYAFNARGNKGIAAGLQNLQKLEDGERLDGSSSAEEDFADDDLL